MPRLMPLVVRHAPAICAALFFAFGLVAALAVPARGADLNRTDRLFLRPHGLPELRASAPVIAGTVDIAVNGITGRAIARQTFLNAADAWVEGLYIFPQRRTQLSPIYVTRVCASILQARGWSWWRAILSTRLIWEGLYATSPPQLVYTGNCSNAATAFFRCSAVI